MKTDSCSRMTTSAAQGCLRALCFLVHATTGCCTAACRWCASSSALPPRMAWGATWPGARPRSRGQGAQTTAAALLLACLQELVLLHVSRLRHSGVQQRPRLHQQRQHRQQGQGMRGTWGWAVKGWMGQAQAGSWLAL